MAIALSIFILSCSKPLRAQNENDLVKDSVIQVDSQEKVLWDMSFAFKTMNVFRGLLPSRAPALSTQAGVKAGDFILGFYGGASFNGGYTETDLILIYYRPRFQIRADWYYNFTDGITNIPIASGFFDFDPEVTRGLLDFMVDIKLTKRLSLMSSTFLFGRDRGVTPEDEVNDVPLRRGDQRYSQYTKLSYTWYWRKTKVAAHAAYSFSWDDPSCSTFYGGRPGFNDIGVSLYRKLVDNEKVTIPIKATAYINPVSNNVYLVATIQIIEISKL